ncbi:MULTISPECIES: AraC family transcriptional regulator [Bacillus amyloliquefaciens group]|uniref:AraC family transcriptional regulator n=1 Tax=Bacillus amyloliquefaciens group TaxID=1938374 RepID=UPI00227149F8|nr:AraC family transcriptional regulator [Bacillus velezensis]MCY0091775.1 AraC family transcriptional regulator [Bacillus velezensis]
MKVYKNEEYSIGKQFPFNLVSCNHKPGEVYEIHSHEFVELIYVKSGNGYHTYKGHTSALNQGDVFIIKPGETHGYEIDEHSQLNTYLLVFQPEILQKELRVLSEVETFIDFFYLQIFFQLNYEFKTKLTLNPSEQIKMNLLIKTIQEELKKKGLGYELLIKTKLIEMFIFLSRIYEEYKITAGKDPDDDFLIIKRIANFVENQYAKQITLEQISQLAGMSKSTFTSKFKKQIGTNLIDYRNIIRVKVAKHLLITTKLKIIVIANQVGFADLSNFNKVFKREVGMSPGEYRKRKC